eukprot:Sro2599_g332280.2  (419) ;mRNA; r:9730-10986
MNWERILRRLRTHPEEAAAYCHSVDPSPLLRCLSCVEAEIPPAVIQAFLDAYDDTVYHSDRNGQTPLLQAVRRTAVAWSTDNDDNEEEEDPAERIQKDARQIIQLLLEANPSAARHSDSTGAIPLHFARTDPVSARLLLDAFPQGVHQVDKERGRLPLHYLCSLSLEKETEENNNNNNEEEEEAPLRLALPNPKVAKLLATPTKTSNPVLATDNEGLRPLDMMYDGLVTLLTKKNREEDDAFQIDTLWQVLTVLVQSVVITSPGKTFQMVHALVSLRCPAAIMAEALRRFPDQAVERDAQGRTPLLIAVAMLQQQPQHGGDMCKVICELLKCNKNAARMTDHEGRLAIDTLAEAGVYDEQLFECLVKAEPRAVDTRDLKNKQHPFITAAMAGPDKSNASSVYHLLRAKPHVIQYYMLD